MKNQIKNYVIAVLFLFAPMLAHSAQTFPETIAFQATLSDNASVPLTGNHSFVFSLYADPNPVPDPVNPLFPTPPLWTETQSLLVASGGQVNAELGSITNFPPTLLFNHQYYLAISVDGAAELTPRKALNSVPYSLNSLRLGEQKAVDWNNASPANQIAGQWAMLSTFNNFTNAPANVFNGVSIGVERGTGIVTVTATGGNTASLFMNTTNGMDISAYMHSVGYCTRSDNNARVSCATIPPFGTAWTLNTATDTTASYINTVQAGFDTGTATINGKAEYFPIHK